MLGTILWTIIGGIVIGLIAKWIVPRHHDKIPFWLTALCGIAGVLVGRWLYVLIFHGNDWNWDGPGFDWWLHTWQVVVACVFVAIAATWVARARIGRGAR